MFLTLTDAGYKIDEETQEETGEEYAEGSFLIIAQDPNAPLHLPCPALRALVLDDVRLEQCGHFMMGSVTISEGVDTLGEITLSGPFGADSLPIDLNNKLPANAERLWSIMHPIPDQIEEAFWQDQNHFVQMWARQEEYTLKLWVIEAEV